MPESEARTFARNTFLSGFSVAVQSFRGIFPFLVARLLGEVSLGMLSVGWGWADLLSKFGTWGLDKTTTIRTAAYLARGRTEKAQEVFRRSILTGIGLSMAAAAATYLLLGHLDRYGGDPRVAESLRILLWVLPFLAIFRISNAASWGMKNFRHNVFTKGIVEPGTTILIFLLLFFAGFGVKSPLVAVVAGFAAAAAAAFILARRSLDSLGKTGSPGEQPLRDDQVAGELPTSARIIGWSELLYIAMMRTDVLVLGFYAASGWTIIGEGTPAAVDIGLVGAYGIAVEIAWSVRKIKNIFDPVFTPLFAGTAARGTTAEDRYQYARTCRWMVSLQLWVIGILLLGGLFILRIFGEYFTVALPWLAVLLFANLMNGFLLADAALNVLNPGLNLRTTMISLAVNLFLTVLLVPMIGPLGAALATLAAFTLQSILRIGLAKRLCGFGVPWRDVLPAFAGFAVLAALLGTVEILTGAGTLSSLLCGLAFAVSYGVWASRTSLKGETGVLLKMLRGLPALDKGTLSRQDRSNTTGEV